MSLVDLKNSPTQCVFAARCAAVTRSATHDIRRAEYGRYDSVAGVCLSSPARLVSNSVSKEVVVKKR